MSEPSTFTNDGEDTYPIRSTSILEFDTTDAAYNQQEVETRLEEMKCDGQDAYVERYPVFKIDH